MNNLFELNVVAGATPIKFSAMILAVPEFAKLYKNAKNWETACKRMAYVYFMADYMSEYNTYGIHKESKLGLDLFRNSKYRPGDDVVEAIKKYRELQWTPSRSLYDSALQTINSLKYYFDSLCIKASDSEEVKQEKLATFDFNKVVKSIKDLSEASKTINELIKQIEKEEEEHEIQLRGGGKAGIFEMPDKAKDYLKSEDQVDTQPTTIPEEETQESEDVNGS